MKRLALEGFAGMKKEFQSAIFPLAIFTFLAITKVASFGIARYDAILLLCLAMQGWMLWKRIETPKEAAVIAGFHVIGLGLELYKVNHGSWSYPDDGFKFRGVPLYSGFMYASVASYIMQAWKRFEAELQGFPKWPWLLAVTAAIYLNFFTARQFGDNRGWIFAGVLLVFARSSLTFTTTPGMRRKWPLAGVFLLLGFFVWVGENICTALGAWQYPNQRDGWAMVDTGKISSWVLLVIISFCIVAGLKQVRLRTIEEPVSDSPVLI